MCKRFADVDKLRRPGVALKEQAVVSVARIRRTAETAFFGERHRIPDRAAFRQAQNQVDAAVFQRAADRFRGDIAVVNRFDVRLLPLIVALVVFVDGKHGFSGRQIAGFQPVRAAGKAVQPLTACGFDAALTVARREIPVEMCAAPLVGNLDICREPHIARQRCDVQIRLFEIIRHQPQSDVDGKPVFAQQPDAPEWIHWTVPFRECVIAGEGEAVIARGTEFPDRPRGKEQDFGDVILRGDRRAVVPLQVLRQIDGKGLRAVCFLRLRDGCDGFVIDRFAGAGPRNQGIALREVQDELIRRVVRPLLAAPVARKRDVAADGQLSALVAAGAIAAAEHRRDCQHHRQQEKERSFFHGIPSVSFCFPVCSHDIIFLRRLQAQACFSAFP